MPSRRTVDMGFSILSQGIGSLQSIVLTILIARILGFSTLGVFSLIVSVYWAAIGIHNAMISTPISIYTAERNGAPVVSLAAISTLNLAMCALTFAIALVLGSGSPLGYGPALLTAAYVSTGCFREFQKSVAYVQNSVRSATAADVLCAFVAITGSLIALLGTSTGLTGVLLACVAGNLVSIGLMFLLRGAPGLARPARALAEYRVVVAEIAWSVLGVAVTEVHSRGYVYLTALFLGPTTLGHLQALRSLFQPVGLLVAGWSRLARVKWASLAASGDGERVWREACGAAAAVSAGALVFGLMIIALEPWLSPILFGADVTDGRYIASAWTVAVLASSLRMPGSLLAQVRRRFRDLTLMLIGASVLSLVIVAIALLIKSSPLVAASTVAADCLLAYILLHRDTGAMKSKT